MELTQNQDSHDEDFNSEVTYYKIFSDPLMIALLIAQVILSIACNYYCPVLLFRLLDFTDSPKIHGFVFGCLISGYS